MDVEVVPRLQIDNPISGYWIYASVVGNGVSLRMLPFQPREARCGGAVSVGVKPDWS
jgi:hypothetical protein